MTTTASPAGRRPSGTRGGGRGAARSPRALASRVALYAVLITAAAVILVPFVWMVSSSLKRNNDVFTIPIQWIPHDFQWRNFTDIWTKIPMSTYLRNYRSC